MTEPNDKQKEAREISRAMTLEGVRWRRKNFWANEGQTTRDFDFLLSLLLRSDKDCWCHYVDDTRACGPACLAARALWEKVQPAKEGNSLTL